MPRDKSTNGKPRLVQVKEIPARTRRSVYYDLVQEFAKSDMNVAKIEGVKTSAAVSVRKAIAATKTKGVKAVISGGEVYLTKQES